MVDLNAITYFSELNYVRCLNKSVFLCVCADEQMYRCEDCDELFSSTLELRRHQKYSCSSAGSIFDTLREDFKQEREDSDEPVHECKDCEKIFPNEYRYTKIQ